MSPSGLALRGRGLWGHGAREAPRDLRLPRRTAAGLDQDAAGGPAAMGWEDGLGAPGIWAICSFKPPGRPSKKMENDGKWWKKSWKWWEKIEKMIEIWWKTMMKPYEAEGFWAIFRQTHLRRPFLVTWEVAVWPPKIMTHHAELPSGNQIWQWRTENPLWTEGFNMFQWENHLSMVDFPLPYLIARR